MNARIVLRLGIIFGVLYMSLFGGIVEHLPLMKLVHQVGATLMIAAWLVSLLVRRIPFPSTPLDKPIVVGLVAITLSAAFARDPRVSLEAAWPLFIHVMLLYLLVDLMRRGRQYQRWIMEALFITAAVIVLLSFVELVSWYFGLSLLPQVQADHSWPEIGGFTLPPNWRLLSVALGHKNPLGYYCLVVIPLAVGWARTQHRRDYSYALWGLGGLLVGVLVLSQSRGAYLGFIGLLGMQILFWLLDERNKARFPRFLQPLLRARVLVSLAILALLLAVVLLLMFVVYSPDPDDKCRLDLWQGALFVFQDNPVLGAGPSQFATERFWYPHTEFARGLFLRTAHNLPLNVLAEGGIVGIVASVWFTGAFAKHWLRTWQGSDRNQQVRLGAIVSALVAAGLHNMVDTFLATQTMIPLLIAAAYTLTRGEMRRIAGVHAPVMRRAIASLLLVFVFLVQVIYIPVHRAGLAHARALTLFNNEEFAQALKEERRARQSDPWLGLYSLQEAVILGHLADTYPDNYLNDAITAFETGLERNPAWSIGWHNLAALYAQQGDFDRAIAAEEQAIRWDVLPAGYYLKLGEYFEAANYLDEAAKNYLEALSRADPAIVSSGFWTNPEHPERQQLLDEAIVRFREPGTRIAGFWTDPMSSQEKGFLGDHFESHALDALIALKLAIYAGDIDSAEQLMVSVDREAVSGEMRDKLDAMQPDPQDPVCFDCFYFSGNPYLVLAEHELRGTAISPEELSTAEHAAETALFMASKETRWAWYILARIAEERNEPEQQVNELLGRGAAVSVSDDHLWLARGFYGLSGDLGWIPQARMPVLTRDLAKPWLILAERLEASEGADDLRHVYELLLEGDPYAWEVEQRLNALAAMVGQGERGSN